MPRVPGVAAPPEGDLVVLGLDPGSRVTGYGLVAERSGVLRLVAAGTIRLGGGEMVGRMGALFTELGRIIAAHSPCEAAMETVFTAKNAASAIKLGQARGAALAALGVAGLPVDGYAPTDVKKSLVGAGRADKSQVAFMVGRLLGQRSGWAPAADASDALAVALCHLNHRRLRRMTG